MQASPLPGVFAVEEACLNNPHQREESPHMIRRLILPLALVVLAVPAFAEQIKTPRNIEITFVDDAALPALARVTTPRTAIAAKDGETGELRAATADEMKTLSTAISVMFKRRLQPVVSSNTDGVLTAQLDESFQNLTLVMKTAEGDIDHACVVGGEGAAQFLSLARSSQAVITREEK
jgi:hypothetical protein